MSDNILKVMQPKSVVPHSLKVVETIGDMKILSNGQVTIEGYAVPRLEIGKGHDDNGAEVYHISLDNRFGYFAKTSGELYTLISIVANAMAIIKGYSSFGKHCRPVDEFNVLPLGYEWDTNEAK